MHLAHALSEMIEKVLTIYTGGGDQDVLASLLSSLLNIYLYIKLTFTHVGDLCLQNSVFGWMETVIAWLFNICSELKAQNWEMAKLDWLD